MMGEEGVDKLRVGMKGSLRESFEQVHAQASSVLLLTLKWRDLHEHYEKIERDLEERALSLRKAERVFEERRKEMSLKEDKSSSLEAQIYEFGEQLDGKRKEVDVEEGQLHSGLQKLKSMRKELDSIQKSLEERSKEVHVKEQHLAAVEKSLKAISASVELEKKELSSVVTARTEQLKELEMEQKEKENENVSLRRSVEKRFREVEMKELQLDGCRVGLSLKQKEILDACTRLVDDQWKLLQQVVLNEISPNRALVLDQVSSMIKANKNPTKSVLNAVEELYSLAAFRIFSAFRMDEYGALLDRVGGENNALKLQHHLGMTDTAKAGNIPLKVKTEELGEDSGSLNKRRRTDGYLNAS